VEFAEEMLPLDAEFAQVLHNNLWDLYLLSTLTETSRDIPDYIYKEDILTLQDWELIRELDDFTADDIDVYYGTEIRVSDICAFISDPPDWATHVILFEK
jgi:hypothetical protein